MRWLEVLLVLCVIGGSTRAEPITDPARTFSMLCAETSSAGLDWDGRGWKPTGFRTEQYLISKVKPKEPELFCKYAGFTILDENTKAGCYDFRKMGEKSIIPGLCKEYWSEGHLVSIDCEGPTQFHGEVDGPFVTTRTWAPFLTKDGSKKDSLVISTGSCALLPN